MYDAALVNITNKNIKYWDVVNQYHLSYESKNSNFIAFIDIGFPHSYQSSVYYDHGLGSNIGLRKYKAFDTEYLMFGFEYTRLLQSRYYNILPSPNWYDNNLYNYHSYNGLRWSAHSGSDSDDFLFMIGLIKGRNSIIYGLNYERHGVSYHFPPETKFESRFSLSFERKNIFFQVDLENEYFEHFNFIDTNTNVWNETFEKGSVQRTNSALFSIEYRIL